MPPSVFVQNGTMPIAFTIYGVFAYAIIASMFLLVCEQMTGNKLLQGLNYGLFCAAIWIAYLLEPLPHVAPIDRITYPLADTAALLVMGVLLGALLAKTKPRTSIKYAWKDAALLLPIVACFVLGRLLQYEALGIYSSYAVHKWETIVWVILTGVVIALACAWINRHVRQGTRISRALIVGCLLFGADYALFNFFMPLVFDASIPDLIARTAVDTIAVSIGCLFLPCREKLERVVVRDDADARLGS